MTCTRGCRMKAQKKNRSAKNSRFRPGSGGGGRSRCALTLRICPDLTSRRKIGADFEYAEIVRDSRRKWRDAHPDYQKTYRESHQAAVARNRQLQGGRHSQRLRRGVAESSSGQLFHRRTFAPRLASLTTIAPTEKPVAL